MNATLMGKMREIAKSQMLFFVSCPYAHFGNFRATSGVPSDGLSGLSGSRNMQFPSFFSLRYHFVCPFQLNFLLIVSIVLILFCRK